MRALKRRPTPLAPGRRPTRDGASQRRWLRSQLLLAILSLTLALVPISAATGAAGTGQAMAGPLPPQRSCGGGVNLTRRVVYLTRSGAVTRILDASPGKPSTPTPTGGFKIFPADRWLAAELAEGVLWRPNYFYRGYALHGSTSVPTSAASHGCVRVTIPAMNRVWSQLFIGERVYVYR